MKENSPFAYRNFVGRVLIDRETQDAYTVIGWVGTHQFIVRQEGSDLELFIPIRKLHKYCMLPREQTELDKGVSDDELACAE